MGHLTNFLWIFFDFISFSLIKFLFQRLLLLFSLSQSQFFEFPQGNKGCQLQLLPRFISVKIPFSFLQSFCCNLSYFFFSFFPLCRVPSWKRQCLAPQPASLGRKVGSRRWSCLLHFRDPRSSNCRQEKRWWPISRSYFMHFEEHSGSFMNSLWAYEHTTREGLFLFERGEGFWFKSGLKDLSFLFFLLL